MKLTELRIGNVVYQKDWEETIQLTVIGEGRLEAVDGRFWPDEIEPVLLDENILKCLGFEESIFEWFTKEYFTTNEVTDRSLDIQFNLKLGIFKVAQGDYVKGGSWRFIVKYLHQLQNIYYFVLGHELDVSGVLD